MAGVLPAGVDALVLGVLPTPAVAFLTPVLGAAGGAVLSASHNPFEDNGVKLFSGDGDKLPDAWEDEIEARLGLDPGGTWPTGARIGRLRSVPGAARRYLDGLRASLPAGFRGVKPSTARTARLPCRSAPVPVARGRGDTLGVRPTGTNINRGVGALHPEGSSASARRRGDRPRVRRRRRPPHRGR